MKRKHTILLFSLLVATAFLTFFNKKMQIENVGLNLEASTVSLDSFSDVCEWSDTIVKAEYIKKEDFDGYSNIYIFELEEDYIGNVNEKRLHVYESADSSFIKGKSYYLFMSSFNSPLYPHVVYRRTNTNFLMGDSTERNSEQYTFYQDYSLGLNEVTDISSYIKTEVVETNSYLQQNIESLEEACKNIDAIYKIKVGENSPINRFVSSCSYTITEKLRERYSIEEIDIESFSDEIISVGGLDEEIPLTTICPSDAVEGDEFILLLKYNEYYNCYFLYSDEHFLYPLSSSEAQYIINEVKE